MTRPSWPAGRLVLFPPTMGAPPCTRTGRSGETTQIQASACGRDSLGELTPPLPRMARGYPECTLMAQVEPLAGEWRPEPAASADIAVRGSCKRARMNT